MLIVFGGLPGTGKTTLARAVAAHCGFTYLRIDSIEQAMRSAEVLSGDVGPAGYISAYELAEENLNLGQSVIADCVNPLPVTRAAWRAVAEAAASSILEIEVLCSDIAEHQRRVESRASDIPGHVPPTWASVLAHEYEPWKETHLVIDTAKLTVEQAVVVIGEHLKAEGQNS